jgi:hypothetical protein
MSHANETIQLNNSKRTWGRHWGPWSPEQNAIIFASIPAWSMFALDENGTSDGCDVKLTKWKQHEAERILQQPAFKTLPNNVSSVTFLLI